jgi:DNA-binding MarR family transcriptional regulator
MSPARTAEPSALSDREYEALASFRHALRVFLHFSETAARDEGVTPSQHQLLLAVRGWKGDRAPSIGQLAELLQLQPHSTLGLVQRAEAAGLIVTHPDPDDARRRTIDLTAEGARVLEHLSLLHRRELRRFRSQMADLLDILD